MLLAGRGGYCCCCLALNPSTMWSSSSPCPPLPPPDTPAPRKLPPGDDTGVRRTNAEAARELGPLGGRECPPSEGVANGPCTGVLYIDTCPCAPGNGKALTGPWPTLECPEAAAFGWEKMLAEGVRPARDFSFSERSLSLIEGVETAGGGTLSPSDGSMNSPAPTGVAMARSGGEEVAEAGGGRCALGGPLLSLLLPPLLPPSISCAAAPMCVRVLLRCV